MGAAQNNSNRRFRRLRRPNERRRASGRRLALEALESRHLLAQIGGLAYGDIFPAGDIDSHSFVIDQQHLDAAGGPVSITLSLSDANASFIPKAALFGPQHTLLGSTLSAGNKVRYELRDPGVYTVLVQDNDHRDTGPYALSLAGLNPPSSDAIALDAGETFAGSLLTGQVATHTFQASEKDVLTISLADTSSSAAGFFPRAELYDSATGSRLSLLDATTRDSQREMSAGRKYVTRPLPRTGSYVIQVYDNNYSDSHANGYVITLEGLSPPSENAVELVAGAVADGRIELGQIDAYRFVGNEGDLITISMSEVVGGLTHRLWAELFSPTGQRVNKLGSTSNYNRVENGRQVIYRLPETATADNPYVVQVYDDNYTDEEDYALLLDRLNPVQTDASTISPGDVMCGTIGQMGQVNTYFFSINQDQLTGEGESYQVRVAFESDSTIRYQPSATVFSPTGQPLTEVKPRHDKLLVLDAPGDYVIQVKDASFTHTSVELTDGNRDPEYKLSLLDAQPPRVSSVAVNESLLTDAHAGTSFEVAVIFDESMDTSVTPSVTFTPNVAGVSGATLVGPATMQWSSTYTMHDTFLIAFQVNDQNVQVNNVSIGVTGGRDAAANLQQNFSAPAAFGIDTRNPTPSVFHPEDNAVRVAWDADLVIEWNKPVQRADGEILIRRRDDDSVVEAILSTSPGVRVAGATVTIEPETPFQPETAYYIEVSQGAFLDLVGNASVQISGRTSWNFTTTSVAARNAPFVARSIDDRSMLQGPVHDEVDLVGVFDDLDIPQGDQLTIEFDNQTDNSNPILLTGELHNNVLVLSFDPNQFGSSELTVHARDLAGQTVSETFTIRVMAAPIAEDDSVSTPQNEAVAITVYQNDDDPDGMVVPETVQLVPDSGPSYGTVTLDSGVFTYTPAANHSGTDTFRYTIRDDDGWISNEAQVTITIIEVPPFHNAALPYDVDNSGNVSPIDVLILINYLNQVGSTLPPAPIPPEKPSYYFDVAGDGAVTPLDVLMVINYLNQQAQQGSQQAGEGEAAMQSYGDQGTSGGKSPYQPAVSQRLFEPVELLDGPIQIERDTALSFIQPLRNEIGDRDEVFGALGAHADRKLHSLTDDLFDDLLRF
jgi:hypothetical protein